MSEATQRTAPPDLVDITQDAMTEVKNLLAKEEPGKALRLAVQGGGCSGLSYKLQFDMPKDNDYVVQHDGISVLIDPKSAIYLKGIRVDYQSGLEGKGFTFTNPNATSTCGCGESFSV
jgi:iron-sulfur cluster assembly protein